LYYAYVPPMNAFVLVYPRFPFIDASSIFRQNRQA